MKITNASFEFIDEVDGLKILQRLEYAGRTCYKSEDKISETSSSVFVKMIIERGHETVLEHEKVSVKVVCDRGVSHEIVRHRIASYSQESTRYCNYSKDRFGNEITVVEPCFWNDNSESNDVKYQIWKESIDNAEKAYFQLIEAGASPQEARSVLPNSLKTEIVMTMNLREWRHFFRLRTSSAAHPQMLEIARPMLNEFKNKIPIIFDDISY